MIYIIADRYIIAKDHILARDLNPAEVRYVSCAAVLKGVSEPEVVVLGDGAGVTDEIVELLARKAARVSYEPVPPSVFTYCATP